MTLLELVPFRLDLLDGQLGQILYFLMGFVGTHLYNILGLVSVFEVNSHIIIVKMQNLENIAGYILNKFQGNVTPMKLQKMLYYVKVWTTVAGEKTISNSHDQSFYAWKYGPVNPDIYHKYKAHGKNPIKDTPLFCPISSDEKKLIDFIIDSYGCFNAITLSKTTHTEDPWIKNQEFGGKISDEEILDYYSKESFAQNFPLDKAGKYYPPKTTSHHAYVFDMAENDEAANFYFDSLEEYLDEFKEASKEAHMFMNSNTEIFG